MAKMQRQWRYFQLHVLQGKLKKGRKSIVSDVNSDAVFGGDHVSGAGQVHEHWAQMRERGCDGHVQPIWDWCGVAKRTDPEAVANAVPDVMWRQRDEKHPGQRAPGVFEPAGPHEEAQREAERWDQRGAVQRRPVWQIHSSLWKTDHTLIIS